MLHAGLGAFGLGHRSKLLASLFSSVFFLFAFLPVVILSYYGQFLLCKNKLRNLTLLLADGERAEEPIGSHPESGDPVYVKNGRYGPYVTDGKTNVTVPKGTDPLEVTAEQAKTMLDEKRKAPKKKATPGGRRGAIGGWRGGLWRY